MVVVFSNEKLGIVIVENTLDRDNPREWYYALMDYGSYLGDAFENPNRRSRHYSIQSTFIGSRRQLRGQILRLLLAKPLALSQISRHLKKKNTQIQPILDELMRDGFIINLRSLFSIS